MIHQILKDKPTKLFLGITAFFVANALIAECIGGKIFSLESVFGFKPMNLTLFGESGLAFNLTCGVLLWPLEFVITDIVNEYYGPKAVRRISLIAVALNRLFTTHRKYTSRKTKFSLCVGAAQA